MVLFLLNSADSMRECACCQAVLNASLCWNVDGINRESHHSSYWPTSRQGIFRRCSVVLNRWLCWILNPISRLIRCLSLSLRVHRCHLSVHSSTIRAQPQKSRACERTVVVYTVFCVSSCPVSYHCAAWLIRPITHRHAHVFLLFSLK